jgi:hypothetical protein
MTVATVKLAILAHHRFLHACADGEDRAMGRVDDRVEIVDAEHAEIGDGELPPTYSCGASLRSRARVARSFISAERAESDFMVRVLQDRA